jgi:hypothetical protein
MVQWTQKAHGGHQPENQEEKKPHKGQGKEEQKLQEGQQGPAKGCKE